MAGSGAAAAEVLGCGRETLMSDAPQGLLYSQPEGERMERSVNRIHLKRRKCPLVQTLAAWHSAEGSPPGEDPDARLNPTPPRSGGLHAGRRQTD